MKTSQREQALTDLYHATAQRVYAYVRRHTDADAAESVVAEVFVKAWKHVDQVLDGDPMPWLIVTAKRTLVDHHRGAARQSRLKDTLFAQGFETQTASPEDSVIERQMLHRALAQLSPDDQECLLLIGWDGLDHATAARVMGCNTLAFRKRLSRARQRLAELLEAESVAPISEEMCSHG